MNYAVIKDGLILNVIIWDGVAELGYPEDIELVKVPDDVPIYIGGEYKDGQFIIPPIPDEDIIKANTNYKASLMAQATEMISILTDATDPDIMGDDINPEDVTNLKLWKAYRVQLPRVTDMLNPVWPKQPNA